MEAAMPKRAAAGEGRRRAVNTKITDAVREKLEEAARESDRTLSHEIEYRLEKTFSLIGDAMFSSSKVAKLMEVVAAASRVAEMKTGKTIDDDRETFDTAIHAVREMFSVITALP